MVGPLVYLDAYNPPNKEKKFRVNFSVITFGISLFIKNILDKMNIYWVK